MSRAFDAIVIGAGQAGPPLVGRMNGAGMKVAMVERHLFGGTCVNTGCKPTKTMVASAYAAHLARRAADFGVVLPGGGNAVTVDMKVVKARLDKIIHDSRGSLETWLGAMKNVTLFRHHGRFTGPHEVEVGGERLTSERIFLDVGGRATIPDLPGVEEVKTLTNATMLALDELPEHLVVVGGSYIGLEFAQAYRRFGARVTVLEKGPRLVAREDEDVSLAIRGFLEAEGITVRTGAACIRFARRAGSAGSGGSGETIEVGVDCTTDSPTELASHVLLAVGRTPNTDDLGTEAAGIERDARGYLTVDDELRTSAPGVWAMGDCNGRGAFTHTSYNDFEIVAANLLDSDRRRVTDRIVAYALYTDPPLGRCGLTEEAARKTGKAIKVATRPMTRVGRAVEKDETAGFMKIVVDAASDAILGASILGTGGDEAIHGILDTMYAGGTATSLKRTVPIHPTVSELIPTMIADLK